MKNTYDYRANIALLSDKAHKKMMLQGMSGIYSPINICGVSVTCSDTSDSTFRKLYTGLMMTEFQDIDNAILSLTSKD